MNIAQIEPKIREDNFIPSYLVKEEIDGKPYAYKGYKSVLSNEKTLEDIMGSSTLQAFLISYLLRILYKNLDEHKYEILTNEIGVHLKHKSNLACDIAIFEKDKLFSKKITKQYSTIAPKVVIEIDTDVELPDNQGALQMEMGFVSQKTQALLQFGVEKVIWVLTDSQKILVANSLDDWHLFSWNRSIEILDGVGFSFAQFIDNELFEI